MSDVKIPDDVRAAVDDVLASAPTASEGLDRAIQVLATWVRRKTLLDAAEIVHNHRFEVKRPPLISRKLSPGIINAEIELRWLLAEESLFEGEN